ncbi:MAG: cupin domain-containing protein [Planctomycetota bacterium JB042]
MNDRNDRDVDAPHWIEHVLGSLDPDEARALEERLARGEGPSPDELRRARDLWVELALAGRPAAPPPGLKDRLVAAIRSGNRDGDAREGPEASSAGDGAADDGDVQVWRRWRPETDAKERLLVRADDGEFEPTAIEGIRVRRLAFDAATDRVTMMIRMEAGTRYPPHRHAGAEECYVLEGDLRHRDQVMRAGDFELVDGGSIHDDQWSEGGCLLLVHASVHDELLSE